MHSEIRLLRGLAYANSKLYQLYFIHCKLFVFVFHSLQIVTVGAILESLKQHLSDNMQIDSLYFNLLRTL